jgi:phosphohistidine phosphatase
MKQIILFRHAKTEERSLLGSDFKRDLKDKGKEDAKKVSKFFDSRLRHPEIVLCSTANRTSQTFEIFKKTTGYEGETLYMEELYHSSSSGILDIIQQHIPTHDRIMVVGHNMGISQLAGLLCKNGCEELPTSGIAVIEFLDKVEPYEGELKTFITPKTI